MTPRDATRPQALAAGLAGLAGLLAWMTVVGGCSTATAVDAGRGTVPARQGRTAASQRVRFAPTQIVLPGGATAPIRPARTVGGVLAVPDSVHIVGWWDGSADAGDPFGATVLAGHVDSAALGVGFFASLLHARPGQTIILRGAGHTAAYKVVGVRAVRKDALATTTQAFDQRGPHRLVLVTCTGRFDPTRHAYDRNLVVTAAPAGAAR